MHTVAYVAGVSMSDYVKICGGHLPFCKTFQIDICVHSSASPSCNSLGVAPVHLSVATVAEGFVG